MSRELVRVMYMYGGQSIVRDDTSWPCLNKFDNLLRRYLHRKLTYEGDILRAFSGILEALTGSMRNGFHFGLPEQFFDVALIWTRDEPLAHRSSSHSEINGPLFPTWSWAGWKGATSSRYVFGLDHERSTPAMDYKPRNTAIFPCVQWFKVICDPLELIEIVNDYSEYRADGLDNTVILPEGWSAVWDDESDSFYYKYDHAPPSYTFWYPIPTVRATDRPRPDHKWSSVLYGKAQRAYLELGGRLVLKSSDPETDEMWNLCPIYELRNIKGDWAGVIFVHEPSKLSEQEPENCELIKISGGFAVEDSKQDSWIAEWNCPGRPRSGEYYFFYHVLWIEWRGSIAYRKGLGCVIEQIWRALPEEYVDIWLG